MHITLCVLRKAPDHVRAGAFYWYDVQRHRHKEVAILLLKNHPGF